MIKKLFGKRLLVDFVMTPEMTDGGVFLPKRERTSEARVREVSEELKGKFAKGDRIIVENFKTPYIQDFFGGVLIDVDDVMAKVE